MIASLLWGWGRQTVSDSYNLPESETTIVIEKTSFGIEETTVTTYWGTDDYRTSTATEITEAVRSEETVSAPEA